MDKYRPTKLEQLHYHPELSGNLQQLAKGGDIPHLLLFGPSGAGKKTRVMCFLRAIYGSAVEKVGGHGRVGRGVVCDSDVPPKRWTWPALPPPHRASGFPAYASLRRAKTRHHSRARVMLLRNTAQDRAQDL